MEQRADANAAFGKGATTTMPFSRFASALKGGATNLYLSTQDADLADDGLPQLLSPMMQKLQGDFPVVPAMMGALVPHAVNLWIGCAPQGVLFVKELLWVVPTACFYQPQTRNSRVEQRLAPRLPRQPVCPAPG